MTRSFGTAMARLQLMAMMDAGMKQYVSNVYIPMGKLEEAATILSECHKKLKKLGGVGVEDGSYSERSE